MQTRVAVALGSLLLAEGIRKVLEVSSGIAAEVLKPGARAKELGSMRPDIILADVASLHAVADEAGRDCGAFILIDTLCSEEDVISAVITKGVKGVLPADSTPENMINAIEAVAGGELWLERINVKSLLAGLQGLRQASRHALSDREWEVVLLVGQGCRNKEIAGKLCISEPTVKAHLQRIFQKLDIRTRPQLITFALKSRTEIRCSA